MSLHDCPGGCGRAVERNKLSCPQDWKRLPKELRNKVTTAWRRGTRAEHDAAVVAAIDWYRNNPRKR